MGLAPWASKDAKLGRGPALRNCGAIAGPAAALGQLDGKSRALARAGEEPDLAAMGADQLPGDGQAEPGAAGSGGAGEGLEQLFPRPRWQARPVIGHLDDHPPVTGGTMAGQPRLDGDPAGARLGCVLGEIGDDAEDLRP